MTYPAAGSISLMEIFNQSAEPYITMRKKILAKGLDQVMKDDSPLAGKFKNAPAEAGPVMQWMEELDYDDAVTGQLTSTSLAITGYLRQEAVTQDSIQHHVRVGTILTRESDGLKVQVSAVSGVTDGSSPWTVTVGEYGNTGSGSLSNDSGGVTWLIESEPWTDATEVTDTRAKSRKLRKCGTQIFAESFEIYRSRENTKMEVVNNEYKHQIKGLTDKLARQEAQAYISGIPPYSGGAYVYGDATERPSVTGLWGWSVITNSEYANTNTFKNLSSAAITKTHIDDLVRHMWLDEKAKFNRGDWVIACHPTIHSFISEFDAVLRDQPVEDKGTGYLVNLFRSKIGKNFPIIADQYIRPGVLHVVNPSAFEKGFWEGDDLTIDQLPQQNRVKRWLVSYQKYGLRARSPRQNLGTIYGIATS